MQLIAATRNAAKVQELERILNGVASVSTLPRDISLEPGEQELLEAGEACADIARNKAKAWSHVLESRTLVIATDGGLLIPALGDLWNPTRTRRIAGEGATDLQRAQKLLELSANLKGRDREIGWIEAVAIARNGELLTEWGAEGAPGVLSCEIDQDTLSSSKGFWIDALWRFPQFGNCLRRELDAFQLSLVSDHWTIIQPAIRLYLSKP